LASPIRVVLAEDHTIVREGLRALLDGRDDVVVVAERLGHPKKEDDLRSRAFSAHHHHHHHHHHERRGRRICAVPSSPW
jgi:hypothetical protein